MLRLKMIPKSFVFPLQATLIQIIVSSVLTTHLMALRMDKKKKITRKQ